MHRLGPLVGEAHAERVGFDHRVDQCRRDLDRRPAVRFGTRLADEPDRPAATERDVVEVPAGPSPRTLSPRGLAKTGFSGLGRLAGSASLLPRRSHGGESDRLEHLLAERKEKETGFFNLLSLDG